MDATGAIEVKDFEEREDPWPFRVGTTMYYAVPSIGLGTMAVMSGMQARFAELQAGVAAGHIDVDAVIAIMQDLFEKVLMPESKDAFITRLNDPAKPVGFKTVMNVIQWLMECYGLRPTEPSPSLSNTSADAGSTSSTGGQLSEVVVTGLTGPPPAA